MKRREFILASNAAAFALSAMPESITSFASAALELENNRIYLAATIESPAGQSMSLRCWLDSGGGSVVLREATARRLGYEIPQGKPDGTYVDIALPKILLGATRVRSFPGTLSYIQTGVTSRDLMGASDVFLPLGIFRTYTCLINYDDRVFELDPSSVFGTRIPIQVSEKLAFPRVEGTIDGSTLGFLVDTGAACSMLSRDIVDSLSARNPSWPRVDGCYGAANMVGGKFDADNVMLRIPSIRLGPNVYQNIVVVSRRAGIFEDSMSRLMSAPIVGALAGSFLKRFTLCIDFPNSDIALDASVPVTSDDWNIVPLCLTAETSGPIIARVGEMADSSLKAAVQAGDKLIEVDGQQTVGVPLHRVLSFLGGAVGDMHELVLERDGRSISVTSSVVRIL